MKKHTRQILIGSLLLASTGVTGCKLLSDVSNHLTAFTTAADQVQSIASAVGIESSEETANKIFSGNPGDLGIKEGCVRSKYGYWTPGCCPTDMSEKAKFKRRMFMHPYSRYCYFLKYDSVLAGGDVERKEEACVTALRDGGILRSDQTLKDIDNNKELQRIVYNENIEYYELHDQLSFEEECDKK